MIESAAKIESHASLPYGLIISRILDASLVDLSDYTHVEVSSTYNTCAVGNMGYVLTDDKWSKKGFIKAKVD